MDYEDIGNISSNSTEETTLARSWYYLFHEIVFTLFSIVGIVADAAIIYTIFRFNRMRTKENIFVANWAIADLCSLLVTPSSYRVISIIEKMPISREVMCIIFHIGSALHMLVIFCVIIVSIDWFIKAYFEKASGKFRACYKYVIGIICMIALLLTGISTGYCLDNVYTLYSHYVLTVSLCGLLIFIIICQLTRAIRKCQKKTLNHPTLKLTLATTYIGCWLLAFLSATIMHYAKLHIIVGIIPVCLIFSGSIVNFSLLYRYDINFQACLLQALKRSGPDYNESACSFDNPIVINRNTNESIEIAFENGNAGPFKNAP